MDDAKDNRTSFGCRQKRCLKAFEKFLCKRRIVVSFNLCEFAKVEANGKTVNISVVKWFQRKEELCIKKKTERTLTKGI